MIDITPYVNEVTKWFNSASEENKKIFLNYKRDDLTDYHFSLGTRIRNHFKLWETIEWEEEIVDGCDISEDHPDNLSMRIIEAVWDKMKEEQK